MDYRISFDSNIAFDCGVDTMIKFFNMIANFIQFIVNFIKFLFAELFEVFSFIPRVVEFCSSALRLLPTTLSVAFASVLSIMTIKAIKRWIL